jgi:ADP-ribosyl-[dinitrogen reductase] hydrolase
MAGELSTSSGPAAIPLASRAAGAYLGLAVGDALGASVEFMTPREIQAMFGVHRTMVGGGWLRLRRGQVTDDTEMNLALGRSILQAGGVVDALAVAEAFSAWMRAKPVDIGNTVRRGIARYRRTGETEVPPNEYDAGNGACMRCLPVALSYLGAEEAALADAHRRQAHVTHHSALSDLGTLTVLRMVQSALDGEGMDVLRALADALASAEPRYRFDARPMENPGGFIVETLVAVFQALFSGDGFEAALVDVVNRGGDADTTGAILGMIAGALYGAEAIPLRWSNALYREVREECRAQSLALLRFSPRWRSQTGAGAPG